MTLNEELVNKTLENHSETLYGNDGLGGLVHCMTTKLSFRTLWTALLALAIPLVPSLIYMWSFTTNAPNVFATKDAIAVVEQKNAVVDEKLRNICEKVDGIRDGLEDVKKSQIALMRK